MVIDLLKDNVESPDMPEAMDELEDRRYIFKDSEFLIE